MFIEQIPETLRNLLSRGALLIAALVGLWLLRYIIIWILTRPLVHLAERVGSPQLDERLREIVTLPVQFVFYACAIIIISNAIEPDVGGALFANRLARTFFILALAVGIYRLVEVIGFSRGRLFSMTGVTIDEPLLPFVRVGLQLLVIAFTIVIIIQEWGYDVSALVAGLGLGGLAFSLAAQDTVANLFGFSMIVGDRPFVVGDHIKAADVEGTVERVGLRSTRIRQADQALVTVPNRVIANSVILNWSRLNKRFLNFTLRIPNNERPHAVQQLIEQVRAMLDTHPHVEDGSVAVFFTQIVDSSLEVTVRCYLKLTDWKVFTQERERINYSIVRIMRDTLGKETTATVNSESTVPDLPPMSVPDEYPNSD